jgi:hypothetical protein
LATLRRAFSQPSEIIFFGPQRRREPGGLLKQPTLRLRLSKLGVHRRHFQHLSIQLSISREVLDHECGTVRLQSRHFGAAVDPFDRAEVGGVVVFDEFGVEDLDPGVDPIRLDEAFPHVLQFGIDLGRRASGESLQLDVVVRRQLRQVGRPDPDDLPLVGGDVLDDLFERVVHGDVGRGHQ